MEEKAPQLALNVKNTFGDPLYKFDPSFSFNQDLNIFFNSWFSESYHHSFNRDHLLLMREVLRRLSLSGKIYSSEIRRKMYAIVLFNYTIFPEEKKELIRKLKINEKGQIKGLLNLVVKNADVFINAPARKKSFRYIVENARSPGPHELGFYLEDRMSLWKQKDGVTPRWGLNSLHLAVAIKRIHPTWDSKIFDRYTFYLGNYGKDWIKNLLEKEKIVDPKTCLTAYEVYKVESLTDQEGNQYESVVRLPVGKRSLWNQYFRQFFRLDKDYIKFCEDNRDFILSKFKEHNQLLETMEGFKDPVKARELMVAATPLSGQGLILPFKSSIKTGLKEIFGFHSPKLVNYLNQMSKDLSAFEFVGKLNQGRLIQRWSKEKTGADLRWRWIKLPIPTSFFSILSRDASVTKLYSVYTEPQIISLWEKILEGNIMDSSIQWREEYTTIQDAISMITPEVAEYLNTLSFNEINSFEKLHDVASREYTRLKNPLVELKLEKLYPSILKTEALELSGDLKLVVPKSNHDMIHWGQYLRICVGSYTDRVAEGLTLVLGVQDKGRVTHCIEFGRCQDSMIIIQFKAMRNESGSQDLALEILNKVRPLIETEYLKYIPEKTGRNPFFVFGAEINEHILFVFRDEMINRVQSANRILPDIDIDDPDEE